MTPEALASLRSHLRGLRDRLLGAGDLPIAALRDDPVAKIDDDAAPLAEMEQVIASRRNQERARLLAGIDDALRRIASEPDLFGICEGCDAAIPRQRLLLVPHTRLCAACQAEEEAAASPHRRRHLTDHF